jgi:hypothetical protein
MSGWGAVNWGLLSCLHLILINLYFLHFSFKLSTNSSMVLIDQNQFRMVLSPELSSFYTNKGYVQDFKT